MHAQPPDFTVKIRYVPNRLHPTSTIQGPYFWSHSIPKESFAHYHQMTMTILRAALAALGSVCALQIPLGHDSSQHTLGGHDHKPPVNTEALQATIKADNLLALAEDLYKVAKLGEPEYNHPTRVIGSAGKSQR
jgi:hypothetical protein